MQTSNRNMGLDILRCIALLFVISVHFFLNSSFYQTPVAGWQMGLMVYMRTLFMTCVPLFMMLSGYLLSGKRISADYYRRIVKIYITYLIAGALCILYDIRVNGKPYGLSSLVLMLLAFEDDMYFWYINMYLGLFLLAPFLNVLYHGLEKPSHKKVLVWSLLAMTALPALLNSHQITHLSWWLNPTSSGSYHEIFPDWWTGMYPITYYILGCYLREFPIRWKRPVLLGALILSILAAGSYNLYRCYGVHFIWGEWTDHKSILTVVISVLLFSLFQNMTCSTPGFLSGLVARISKLSLGAYLLSWIPDQYFYPMLIARQPSAPLQLAYFPIMVCVVMLCSLVLAAVVEVGADLLSRGTLRSLDSLFKK